MTHVYDPATAINDPNGITWGMHPIAWRNDDIPEVGEWNTIDVMFDDLAEAGFAGTEVAGWYPSKEETKEKADAAGLRIVAQWFSSFIVRDGVEAVIPDFRATCEYLQFLGATRIVVSEQTGSVQGIRDICIFENKPVLKDEEWPVLAEGLNKLGEIAHEYGLDLVYHHHLGTVVQTKDETLRLLELTDPYKVSLLFDTGHAYVGDGDVMGLLRGALGRVRADDASGHLVEGGTRRRPADVDDVLRRPAEEGAHEEGGGDTRGGPRPAARSASCAPATRSKSTSTTASCAPT